MHIINGSIRVAPLSETLVRIEVKGPDGFEDRPTFHVLSREFTAPESRIEEGVDGARVLTDAYQVAVPKHADSLEGITVLSAGGEQKLDLTASSLKHTPLPAPGKMPAAWVMADTPRVVPPAWGATPVPPGCEQDQHSGWGVANDAPDIYVFIPGAGGYAQLREDFLRLTGPVPLPPLYAFGLIYSRFFPYTQDDVQQRIDAFRRRGIPLDMFVVDTDWRIGASHGYAINSELFPDMPRFFEEAHARNVRVMFNDHPEPADGNGLSRKELRYRQEGLHSLFAMGLDAWWYDRNWRVGLNPPLPGMRHDLWGMRLYRDLTQQFYPERRPFVLSNTICVQDGKREDFFAPAEHRFPVWWTGDTGTDWLRLAQAIGSAVDLGVTACLPYVSEDLSGFYGQPSAELFVRYLQFGALSPIMRLHAAPQSTRYPWAYGEEVERIVTDYIRLRYRLLPTIYAAAHTATETGQPVLRRCDLLWPEYEQAASSGQYLLGDDLLVAPVTTPMQWQLPRLPEGTLLTEDGTPGLSATYHDNASALGEPLGSDVAPEALFADAIDREAKPPVRGTHTTRWSGALRPTEGAGSYTLLVKAHSRTRFYLDGCLQELNTESKGGESLGATTVDFPSGAPRSIRLELAHGRNAPARCQLALVKAGAGKATATQDVWIPPGRWTDLWTGECIEGPVTHGTESSLQRMPLFVREGGVVFTAPVAQHTGELNWERVTVNAFVPQHESQVERSLMQDDALSNGYADGEVNHTRVTFVRKGDALTLTIHPTEVKAPDLQPARRWTVRFHLQEGASLTQFRIDDNELPESRVRRLMADTSESAMPLAGAGKPPCYGQVIEMELPDECTDPQKRFVLSCRRD